MEAPKLPSIAPKKPEQPPFASAPSGPPHPDPQPHQPPRSAYDDFDLLPTFPISTNPSWLLGANPPSETFSDQASADLNGLLCSADYLPLIPPQQPDIFQNIPHLESMDEIMEQDAAIMETILASQLSASDSALPQFTIPLEEVLGSGDVSGANPHADDGGLLRPDNSISLQAGGFQPSFIVPALTGTMLPWGSELGIEEGFQENLVHTTLNSRIPKTDKKPIQLPAAQPCSKRKRLQDKEQAAQTKRMREIRACVRCRLYRKKCSEDEVCSQCIRIGNRKTFLQPCSRAMLKDVLPFRVGNSRLGQSVSQLPIFHWDIQDPKVRYIDIIPAFATSLPGSQPPTLRVRCRKFLPGPLDVLEESFESTDGTQVTTVPFPPYACLNAGTKSMQDSMNKYLDGCQQFAEADMDQLLTDDLTKLTLAEARRFSRTRQTVVTNALKIQAAAFISEILPVIVSGDTLDIPTIKDLKYRQCGKVLVPISLDYQLDNLYIVYMRMQLKSVHKELNNLIFKASDHRQVWYEIFLTMFALICTLEQVHTSQIAFVRKYTTDQGNFLATVNSVKLHMIEEWKQSAKTLIYHFHVILKGRVPFSQTWTEEKQREANLDDEAVLYLKEISLIISTRRDELYDLTCRDLNNDLSTPLLWLSHLFIGD